MGTQLIKKFLWIDTSINSNENILNLKYLKEEYPNTKIITFNSLQKGIDYLLSKKFRFVYLVISGSLLQEYIKLYTNNINLITCIPITCIYTSKNFKLILEKKKPYDEKKLNKIIFNYINHPFFNPGGVFDNFKDIIKFFKFCNDKLNINKIYNIEYTIKKLEYCNNKLYIENNKLFNNNKLNINSFFENYDYSNLFSFEKINYIQDLIFPFFIYKLLDYEYDKNNLNNFFKLLTNIYNDNKKIIKLLKPLQNLNNIPDIISLKFLLFIYTLDSNFYKDLNYSLLIEKYDIFEPMLLLLNKSIKKRLLPKSINDNLYRCCSLNNKEISKLNEIFLNKKFDLPCGYLFSKSILSFSKNYQIAYQFMNNQNFNENTTPVIIQILRDNNFNDDSYILNIDLKDISFFNYESEVIFLPYSFFTIEKIEETSFTIGDKIINGNIITLDYCCKYKNIISILIKDGQIEEMINKILINNYVKDFLKYKLINKFTKENLILFIKENFIFNKNLELEINKYFNDLSLNNDVNEKKEINLSNNFNFPNVNLNKMKIENKKEDYHKNEDDDISEKLLFN